MNIVPRGEYMAYTGKVRNARNSERMRRIRGSAFRDPIMGKRFPREGGRPACLLLPLLSNPLRSPPMPGGVHARFGATPRRIYIHWGRSVRKWTLGKRFPFEHSSEEGRAPESACRNTENGIIFTPQSPLELGRSAAAQPISDSANSFCDARSMHDQRMLQGVIESCP
jgi:hypothetical protein